MRRLMRVLLALCLLLLTTSGQALEQPGPQLRALLVGVDQFSTQPDTAPAAENNLRRLSAALDQDSRGYRLIRRSLNEALDYAGFEALVRSSFEGAQVKDISLLYIGTHGFYELGQDPMAFSMLLSDGQQEYFLTAGELHRILSPVPGLKVLIIDTCYAGALIDRGLPGDGLRSLFADGNFKVITASGGSEPSFLWSTGRGDYRGGSYFADTLYAGISSAGRFAADTNQDGQITLSELHGFLQQGYGVATPQVYPRQDDSPIFCYDVAVSPSPPLLVSSLVLEQTAFSAGEEELSFSFTLGRPARLAYQLMYQQAQQWQFSRAQVIADAESPDGMSSPGRKDKTLRLSLNDQAASGYVLLFVTTVLEDSATPWAQSLLTVEPAQGDPRLAISAAEGFAPSIGQELALHVAHAFPVRMSLRILDMQGLTVASLAEGSPSRPEHLPDGGSLFYWTGRGLDGSLLAPGQYKARVSAVIGGVRYEADSLPFTLN